MEYVDDGRLLLVVMSLYSCSGVCVGVGGGPHHKRSQADVELQQRVCAVSTPLHGLYQAGPQFRREMIVTCCCTFRGRMVVPNK